MSTKKQFKLSLEDDVVARIEAAANKSGKRSGQEVVEELINIYLPVWVSVNDSMQRAINYQKNKIAEEMAVLKENVSDEAAFNVPRRRNLHIVEDEEMPHGGIARADDTYLLDHIRANEGKRKKSNRK